MMTTVQLDREYNASNCVRSLISVTEALNELIVKENKAINSGRIEEIEPYQAEKARLAASHAQSIRTLASNRAAFCTIDEALLMELRSHTQIFEARMEEQQLLLQTTDRG